LQLTYLSHNAQNCFALSHIVVLQIGGGILKQVAEAYRKLRGTLRFLLGNLSDFDPLVDAVPHDQLPLVDKWLLARHAAVMAEVEEAYEAYQVGQGVRVLGWGV
jgi:isoleucyl-tRNA synthetase